jgi:hypothetical protein
MPTVAALMKSEDKYQKVWEIALIIALKITIVDFLFIGSRKVDKLVLFHDCPTAGDITNSEMIHDIWTNVPTLASAKQIKRYHQEEMDGMDQKLTNASWFRLHHGSNFHSTTKEETP